MARITEGLFSQIIGVLNEKGVDWQLTHERGTTYLTVYAGLPHHVFTLRNDMDIKRCLNTLKGGDIYVTN